jgi:chromosome segregation ATPase
VKADESIGSLDEMQGAAPTPEYRAKELELESLERGLADLVEALHRVRRENRQLEQKLNDLLRENEELKARMGELNDELASAKANRRDKAREAKIREKVSHLLARIEDLEGQ